MWLFRVRFFHAGPSSLAFSRIVIYRAKSRRSGLEWGDLPILFSRNNCSLSVGVFSFSLIWESIAAQFLTFVSHGEQTLVEKDSPSSRTTKSSFFSRSTHFGIVSPFLVGATNTFSELIHPLKNCQTVFWNYTIYPKRSSLSAYSPFEEQAQALLAYCHFHSFLILHFIYYISQRSNANARFFFLSPHTPYWRVRLARFALKTLTSRFTDFFTDFEKKNRLFCSLLERTFFGLSLGERRMIRSNERVLNISTME